MTAAEFRDRLRAATEDQRFVFACASIFVQPPRRNALQVATGLGDRLTAALAGCVRLSLLEPVEGTDRFELLPRARAVAEDALRERSDVEQVTERAAEECLGFVDLADDLTRPDRVARGMAALRGLAGDDTATLAHLALAQGRARLDLEWRSALRFANWAYETGRWGMVPRFSQCLALYFELRGMYAERLAIGQLALQAARESGNRTQEGIELNNMANVYGTQGHHEQALQLYEQSLAIKRDLADRQGEGQTLNNMAAAYRQQGRHDEAMELYERALRTCRELGDRHGEGQILHNMAIVHHARGRDSQALELFRQDLAICRQLGDRHGEGQTLRNMGILAEKTGDLATARKRWEEALAALEGLGVPEEAQVREWLARLDEAEGGEG